MKRAITNTRDKITIDCTDRIAACLAVLSVGRGRYGIDGRQGMPAFPTGEFDTWMEETFGVSAEDAVRSIGYQRIADALDTVQQVYGYAPSSEVVSYAGSLARQLQASRGRRGGKL